MSEYINIPQSAPGFRPPSRPNGSSYGVPVDSPSRRPTGPSPFGRPFDLPYIQTQDATHSLHERPANPYPSNSSVPRVTRVSYGPRPSWISPSVQVPRPNSTPALDPNASTSPAQLILELNHSRPWMSQQNYDSRHPVSWDPLAIPHDRPDTSVPEPGGINGPPSNKDGSSVSESDDSEMEQEVVPEHISSHGHQPQSDAHQEYEPEDEEEHSNIDVSRNTPYRMVGNVYTPPEPIKPKSKAKQFVGGFMTGLKWIPRAMSKNNTRPVEPVAGPSTGLGWYDRQIHQVNPPVNAQHERILNQPQTDNSTITTSPRSSGTRDSHRGPPPDLPLPLPNPHDPPESFQDEPPVPPVESPVQMEPEYASDYDRMDSSDRVQLPDDTFSSRFSRAAHSLRALIHLPWVSRIVSAEYRPGESTRAQNGKSSGSWYKREDHEKLDLLATPASPRPRRVAPTQRQNRRRQPSHLRGRPPHQQRSRAHSDVVTAIRPSRTPLSATSAGKVPVSPGASSHGMGNHSYSYSYYYPNSTPQPLFIYPSAVSPHGRLHVHSDGSVSPGTGNPEMQQPVPVYMLATPAPIMGGSPPGHMHHHHHSPRRHHYPSESRHHHHPLKPSSPTAITMPSEIGVVP